MTPLDAKLSSWGKEVKNMAQEYGRYHLVVNRSRADQPGVVAASTLPTDEYPAKVVFDATRGVTHVSPRAKQRRDGSPVYVEQKTIRIGE